MAPAAADDLHSGGEHHRCADEGTGPVAIQTGAEGGVRLPPRTTTANLQQKIIFVF